HHDTADQQADERAQVGPPPHHDPPSESDRETLPAEQPSSAAVTALISSSTLTVPSPLASALTHAARWASCSATLTAASTSSMVTVPSRLQSPRQDCVVNGLLNCGFETKSSSVRLFKKLMTSCRSSSLTLKPRTKPFLKGFLLPSPAYGPSVMVRPP